VPSELELGRQEVQKINNKIHFDPPAAAEVPTSRIEDTRDGAPELKSLEEVMTAAASIFEVRTPKHSYGSLLRCFHHDSADGSVVQFIRLGNLTYKQYAPFR
jgi:hypothetical protein